MKKQVQYKSKTGILFNIDIQTAAVPPEAEYWGFYLKATEKKTGLSRVYSLLIKKEVYGAQSLAEALVEGEPLEFLKSACLDNYEAGSHPMYWSGFDHGWFLI